MEAREIMARRAPSLEERINALRDKGVVIGGTTYRYNFAQISAATGVSPVSYTHLDVYKRQTVSSASASSFKGTPAAAFPSM